MAFYSFAMGSERRNDESRAEANYDWPFAAPLPFEGSTSCGSSSACGSGVTGKLYVSPSQRPRSIVRQRSLQNGSAEDVLFSNSRLQTGQRTGRVSCQLSVVRKYRLSLLDRLMNFVQYLRAPTSLKILSSPSTPSNCRSKGVSRDSTLGN